MKHYAILITVISLLVILHTSCEKNFIEDDIASLKIVNGSRHGGNDESADSLRLFINNRLANYEVTDLQINDIQYGGIISPDSTVLFRVGSEESVTEIDIKCGIRRTDESGETIGNLHGTKNVSHHGDEVTLNMDASFLGLAPITFDAEASDYEDR